MILTWTIIIYSILLEDSENTEFEDDMMMNEFENSSLEVENINAPHEIVNKQKKKRKRRFPKKRKKIEKIKTDIYPTFFNRNQPPSEEQLSQELTIINTAKLKRSESKERQERKKQNNLLQNLNSFNQNFKRGQQR